MRAVETGLVKKHVRTAHVVELSNRRRVTTPRSRQNRDLVDLIYRDHVSKSEFRGADVGVQCGIVYKLTEGFVGRFLARPKEPSSKDSENVYADPAVSRTVLAAASNGGDDNADDYMTVRPRALTEYASMGMAPAQRVITSVQPGVHDEHAAWRKASVRQVTAMHCLQQAHTAQQHCGSRPMDDNALSSSGDECGEDNGIED
eukprot:scpid89586/ scgid13531/ 